MTTNAVECATLELVRFRMAMTARNVVRKSAALSSILVLALMLSACDRCGDWLKSGNGQTALSCKHDLPKPR